MANPDMVPRTSENVHQKATSTPRDERNLEGPSVGGNIKTGSMANLWNKYAAKGISVKATQLSLRCKN